MRRSDFTKGWNKLAVVLFATFLVFLTTMSVASLALGAPGEEFLESTQSQSVKHPMARPLSPRDPRAQLDPALLNAPPIPVPKPRQMSGIDLDSFPIQEIEFDLATRTERVRRLSASSLAPESADKRLIVKGYPGASRSLEYLGAGIQPETVLGKDDRVRIKNTTKYPWRTMCKLYITFRNGDVYIGSGVLIGNKYVLTAGHCVYKFGGPNLRWAKKIEVIPGMSGSYKPFGSAFAVKLRAYRAWASKKQAERHDFALITLDRKIGDSTGWQGFAYYPDLSGRKGKICGYPGDRDNGDYPYYDDGPIASFDQYKVRYIIDTYGGQSGSGVYHLINGKGPVIFGVHAYGIDSMGTNSGTRIDQVKFKSLKSWISTNR